MAIQGMIDNSPDGRRIGGWAKDNGGAHPLTIEARLDGALVATTTTTEHRPDLDGFFGYLLEFPEPVALQPARDGRLQISARAADGQSVVLGWHATLIDLLAARDIGRQLAPLPLDQMIEAVTFAAQQVARDPARPADDQAAFAQLERLVQTVRGTPAPPETYAEPLSYIATAPGAISPDGSSIVGLNGHIYLRAGSNQLTDQFALDPADPAVAKRADAWVSVFRARAAALEQRGIRYLQTIIPEKVSVVPDYWPGTINTPSPALAAIEERLAADPFYVSTRRALIGDDLRIRTYRKIDTHMTWYGSRLVFEHLCRAAGLEVPFLHDVQLHYQVMVGDFTERFPGLPLLERMELPLSHELGHAGSGITATLSETPDPHHHVGAHYRWHNPMAPIDKKLLVFGNSFFEYRLSPLTLSWWFAHAFRDYEFVWNPDVDMALVDATKPDIVIGQTIERFLPRVPDR